MISDFKGILTGIRDALKADTALQAFSQATWNKALEVKLGFKKRIEINTSELPIIYIAWPHLDPDEDNTLDVMFATFYTLFHQDNRESAPLEMLDLHSHIERVLQDFTEDNRGILCIPRNIANDEGYNHPTYGAGRIVEIQIPK